MKRSLLRQLPNKEHHFLNLLAFHLIDLGFSDTIFNMKILILFVSVFCLFLNPFNRAIAATSECANESKYSEISRTELNQLVTTKSAFVVDVNSKESYQKNHVPTAVHFGSTEDQFAQILPKDKKELIVAYCGGPSCTAWLKAAKKACELGYSNIKHFKGGISSWVKGNSS